MCISSFETYLDDAQSSRIQYVFTHLIGAWGAKKGKTLFLLKEFTFKSTRQKQHIYILVRIAE